MFNDNFSVIPKLCRYVIFFFFFLARQNNIFYICATTIIIYNRKKKCVLDKKNIRCVNTCVYPNRDNRVMRYNSYFGLHREIKIIIKKHDRSNDNTTIICFFLDSSESSEECIAVLQYVFFMSVRENTIR